MESEIDFLESVLRYNRRDIRLLEVLAQLYTRAKRYRDGLRLDRRIVRLKPDCPTAHYNLACSLALLGRKAEAVASLREAVDHGYDDFEWIQKDRDFDPIRDYSPFRDFIREFIPS